MYKSVNFRLYTFDFLFSTLLFTSQWFQAKETNKTKTISSTQKYTISSKFLFQTSPKSHILYTPNLLSPFPPTSLLKSIFNIGTIRNGPLSSFLNLVEINEIYSPNQRNFNLRVLEVRRPRGSKKSNVVVNLRRCIRVWHDRTSHGFCYDENEEGRGFVFDLLFNKSYTIIWL